MKQASLKLKSYATNVNIIDNGNLRVRILNTLLLALGVLAISYVFLLGYMVLNIVERKTLEAYSLNLSNKIADLELEYLSASQKIDLNLAYSLGFKETKIKYTANKTVGFVSGESFLNINVVKNEI